MPAPRRTLLSVLWLENRENPSGPTPLDPIGTLPPPPPPPAPITVPPPDTTTTAVAVATSIINGMTNPTAPDTNSIYKVPLIP